MMHQHNQMNQPSSQNTTPARPSRTRPQPTARQAQIEDALNPAEMRLTELARRCAAESERFYRGKTHDTRFAYELFRRALVTRDEAAWEHIYQQYSTLVDRWVRRSGAFAGSGESGEFFVVAAFTRFWRAITPERFESFLTLASLLHYLQLCSGCVVIDSVRAQSWAEMLPEEALPLNRTPQSSPDEEALDHVSREEFWTYISSLLHSEAERVVVFQSFVIGMTPGDIYNQHKNLFTNINDVYNVKRNVLGRLGRNQELRQMFGR